MILDAVMIWKVIGVQRHRLFQAVVSSLSVQPN